MTRRAARTGRAARHDARQSSSPHRASRPDAARVFRSRLGGEPVGVWSAPGRVNLIGEHTDYNGGLTLPFAIDARAAAAVGPGSGDAHRVVSGQRRGRIESATPAALVPGGRAARGWQAYPFGVLWALEEAGHQIPPLDIALDSSVPSGAGLSSSAAVECAVALAISEYLDLGLAPEQLARVAQFAENDFVGMPCGLMDQMASTTSIAGHALLFDVGRDITEHIPFDPPAASLAMQVINTRVHHALADGEYARRRADCEGAAGELGVDSLSALGPGDLAGASRRLSDDRLVRRVRHVVTENERVRQVIDLLRAGRITAIGPELTASHASLRDDFEVSCTELDVAAEAAERAGALGARMVGGGFGGSVIALTPTDLTGDVGNSVIHAFAEAGFAAPSTTEVTPAAGAHRDT